MKHATRKKKTNKYYLYILLLIVEYTNSKDEVILFN